MHGIHAIRTGGVLVKRPFLTRQGGPITSKLRIIASRSYAPELPVLCWLIEHEEGSILIDAGMCDAAVQPDHIESTQGPFDAWLLRQVCRFIIKPGEGLGSKLRELGRSSAGLRVVLTHLHSDHIDGLADLAAPIVMVNRGEWQHPYHAPKRLLAPMQPQCLDLKPDAASPFGASFQLTRAGDLFAVPTPGHTPHHCSIVLRRGGVTFFFAGDAVYTQDQLLRGELAGGHGQPEHATETMRTICDFARKEPVVFLPAHDPRSEQRLNELELLHP